MLVDSVDPPQTSVNAVADSAYKGFKALLEVPDRVGYALQPFKAAASGPSSIMTVINVCTHSQRCLSLCKN